MRPSEKSSGEVWRLLQEWSDNHPMKRVSQTQMAAMFGVSPSLVSQWKYREGRMQVDDIRSVSDATGIAYGDLAAAVDQDMDHVVEYLQLRRTRSGGPSAGQAQRQRLDELGEDTQDDGPEDGA